MAGDTLPPSGEKIFCVYVYRDPRPGEDKAPIYVGKGKLKTGRAKAHWQYGSHNRVLRAKLVKIKEASLSPIIEIVETFEDETEAFLLEEKLITQFGRIDLKTGTLCNLTDGGKGKTGYCHPDDGIAGHKIDDDLIELKMLMKPEDFNKWGMEGFHVERLPVEIHSYLKKRLALRAEGRRLARRQRKLFETARQLAASHA